MDTGLKIVCCISLGILFLSVLLCLAIVIADGLCRPIAGVI